MAIERLSDSDLEARRDKAEDAGDWPTMERCEAEMERRDRDAEDPAVVTPDDTPSLQDRGVELGSYGD